MPTMKQGSPDARQELARLFRDGRQEAAFEAGVTRSWAERVEVVVEHVLKNLGDTADEIADFLARLGIDGERRDCDECPIARLIYRHIPGLAVLVEGDMVTLTDKAVDVTVYMPAQVGEFIDRFDAGAYAELHDVFSLPGPGDEDDDADDDLDDDEDPDDPDDDELDEEDEDA